MNTGLTTNYDLLQASSKYGIPLIDVKNKDHSFSTSTLGGYIINLEDSVSPTGGALPGTHWVSIYVDPKLKQAVYFDPFGFPPPRAVVGKFSRFLPISYSSVQIQSVQSTVCGYYCLLFVWFMSRDSFPNLKTRLDNFLKLFNSTDPRKNLALLSKYFRKAF
jgi:hypothetical protein